MNIVELEDGVATILLSGVDNITGKKVAVGIVGLLALPTIIGSNNDWNIYEESQRDEV